ncbi:MAG: hypothetical protein Q4B72_05200 [Lachnospiraceae bacterium]|nr:hypothetical protein [Lachnospiraceae bacterium]
MDTYQFICIVVMAFGMYLIYSCVQLKVSGVPTKGVMISGRINFKNAKDVPGFTAYVFKRCLIVGISIFVISIVSLIANIYQAGPFVSLIFMIILLALCMYYSRMISYAQQTFILGLDVAKLKERQKQMKMEKKKAKKNVHR